MKKKKKKKLMDARKGGEGGGRGREGGDETGEWLWKKGRGRVGSSEGAEWTSGGRVKEREEEDASTNRSLARWPARLTISL